MDEILLETIRYSDVEEDVEWVLGYLKYLNIHLGI